jgi:hypothetical protein
VDYETHKVSEVAPVLDVCLFEGQDIWGDSYQHLKQLPNQIVLQNLCDHHVLLRRQNDDVYHGLGEVAESAKPDVVRSGLFLQSSFDCLLELVLNANLEHLFDSKVLRVFGGLLNNTQEVEHFLSAGHSCFDLEVQAPVQNN